MNNTKVIVFDLYNTLIEIKVSNYFFLQLFRSSTNHFDLSLSSYLELVMKNDIEYLKSYLPKEFSNLYYKRLNELELELNSVIVYEEVNRTLKDLNNNYRLFLISNLASPYKEPVFSNNLNQYFEKLIFSCDYGYLKPEEDIFKEVEGLTGSKKDEILMIGDSYKSDIVGARNMGWNYLKINRKGSIIEDHEINSLNELDKHITIHKSY